MSYEPTNWQTGDIITAEKLNKLEQGVSGGSGERQVFEMPSSFETDAALGIYAAMSMQSFGLIPLVTPSNPDFSPVVRAEYYEVGNEIYDACLAGQEFVVKLSLQGGEFSMIPNQIAIQTLDEDLELINAIFSFNVRPTEGLFLSGVIEHTIVRRDGADITQYYIRYIGNCYTVSES